VGGFFGEGLAISEGLGGELMMDFLAEPVVLGVSTCERRRGGGGCGGAGAAAQRGSSGAAAGSSGAAAGSSGAAAGQQRAAAGQQRGSSEAAAGGGAGGRAVGAPVILEGDAGADAVAFLPAANSAAIAIAIACSAFDGRPRPRDVLAPPASSCSTTAA